MCLSGRNGLGDSKSLLRDAADTGDFALEERSKPGPSRGNGEWRMANVETEARYVNSLLCIRHSEFILRACCCSSARVARGCARNLSFPVVASQRYTLAAETSSRRANLATESPSCLRSRTTDLPVGRIFGIARAESPTGAGRLVAVRLRLLRTGAFRFALLETVDWSLVGMRFRRATGRGFFPAMAKAARLSACRRFFVSVLGAVCSSLAPSRSMPKMSPS